MDNEKMQLLATVAAMKLMLGRLYSIAYGTAKLTPEQVRNAHQKFLETLPTQTLVKSNDPAMSDVLSDEIAREIRSFLLGIEKDFERAQRQP